MKKFITLLILALLVSISASANPIMPESLIAEVYFENGEWYLAIDNELLLVYGIEDFENIQIFCNDGPLLLSPGFLPDFSQYFTILTNENLLTPVEIQRSGDYIVSNWYDPNYGLVEFTELIWNDNLPSPVCGPFEGQSLSVVLFPVSYEDYEWWLVKNNSPLISGGSYVTYGTFSGYVYDLNNIPVPNARIDYVESSYIQFPYNSFDTLLTNDTGYFTISNLPARNYHISNIYKDNQQFFVNEYISIEPDSINFYEFTIDYIVGQKDIETSEFYKVSNFPNPFNKSTVFLIEREGNLPLNDAYIEICNLDGKIVSILPVNNIPDINGKIKINWPNSSGFGVGNYIYSLHEGKNILTSGKMIISK